MTRASKAFVANPQAALPAAVAAGHRRKHAGNPRVTEAKLEPLDAGSIRPRRGSVGGMARPRIFATSFASIHPLYVAKVARKERDPADVDRVIRWLTGYDEEGLREAIADGRDLEAFFEAAPAMNPNASLITGVICGLRVEEIGDPLMRKIRYMDKLVDEVARGKRMGSILRGDANGDGSAG